MQNPFTFMEHVSIHIGWSVFVRLSLHRIPLECPVTTELLKKDEYDFTV